MTQPAALPLAGIRVLDMSRLFPGNYATLILAGLGAEVIKIEDTSGGDGIRQMLLWPEQGESAGHLVLNRGKKSVSLDLKTPEAQQVMLELVAKAEVLVDSFRPGVLDRLGLDSETLLGANPRLVHISITAFGADGPYTQVPAHDLNCVGYTGILSLVADSSGAPVMPGIQLADAASGIHTALAVMAGLRVADKQGTGYRANVAMSDAAAMLSPLQVATVAGTSAAPPVPDLLSGQLACYRMYRCADDRWITVGGLEPKFFGRMLELMDRTDLASLQFDPSAQAELMAALEATFATRPSSQWLELLAAEDTCVGPVLGLDEALAEQHFVERGTVTTAKFRNGQQVPVFRAVPWDQRSDNGASAPALGADTQAVLEEIGLDPNQIAALRGSADR